MASSSLASRLFANALKGIELEKAEQLKREWEARRAAFDAEEAKQRADAMLLAKRRKDLDDRERREREELTELEKKARDALARGEEERRIDAAAARAAVFRGSGQDDVRARLRSEGVPEGLAQDITRLRTLDQTFENAGGMRARMLERDDPVRAREERLYRSIDESVGGAGSARHTDGTDRQYLRADDPADLYDGVPDTVRGLATAPGVYEGGTGSAGDVRKGLGIDQNPMYR